MNKKGPLNESRGTFVPSPRAKHPPPRQRSVSKSLTHYKAFGDIAVATKIDTGSRDIPVVEIGIDGEWWGSLEIETAKQLGEYLIQLTEREDNSNE